MVIREHRCKFCKRILTENRNLKEFCSPLCYQSDLQMHLMLLNEISNTHSPAAVTGPSGGGDKIPKDYGPIFLTVEYDGVTQFDFKFKAPSTSTLEIYDGDGTVTEVVGNDATEVTHTTNYSEAGTYYFYVEGDVLDITYIAIYGQTFVSGSINGWIELLSLSWIIITTTNLTGDISLFAAHPTLQVIQAQVTNITGDISKLYSTTNLATLTVQETNITFDSVQTFPNVNANLQFTDCNLTSEMVDNALKSFAVLPLTGCFIKLAGNNAARTSASDAAFATVNANNTLTVNS